ncbi:MAG: NgoFVII family restriction endonuclease [Firmicutes bacterium]|nr:NgoFVII family restriction endonuclease [Bacillota bacterium]
MKNAVSQEFKVGKDKIESVNCITGDKNHLYPYIKNAIKKAEKIDIIVSFLMESGVKYLQNDLKYIVDKDIPIRIITGNYLNITQPSALYLLKSILGEKADIRFYSDSSRSFHTKAYIFEYKDGGDIFIGSSNISKSAMTSGIEWNYRITKEGHEKDFEIYQNTFEDLFLNYTIIVNDEELERYSKNWKRPKVYNQIEEINGKTHDDELDNTTQLFKPRGAQIEALYNLKKKREEGINKGLIVAATGVGKTFLAAFDSLNYEKILFIAHREEILIQSEETFRKVRPEAKTGFFMNVKRNNKADIIFASVQTLGKNKYLNEETFKKDYFDYIIIDEFHHAVAGNYKNIIEYFNTQFMLGLTATPDRLDNKDVYELCDYNLIYEASLKAAINKGWLVPFRYYGIYDDSIDYNKIDIKKGKYNGKELEEALSINKRAKLIFKNYNKYKSKRALGFCTSKKHAEFMARFFNKNGIKACSVYSGDKGKYCLKRNEAIDKLRSGELKIIFSVDIFNEGLDIKAVDMVLFLRPTESPTVFLQQLGRGLRKYNNKKYLNVLDFIGNFKKANLIPFLLKGNRDAINKKSLKNIIPTEEELPEDCYIDFDFRLVDMFKRMADANNKLSDIILEEYYRIKEDLIKRPSRVDLLTYMDNSIYYNMKKKSDLNLFKNFIGFLNKNDELIDKEKKILGTIAEDFINIIETTNMAKTYKMPILLAFYNNGNIKMKINYDDIYISFYEFYSKGSNGIDMIRHKSTVNYKNWGKKEYVKLAIRNPIKYLNKTHSDFFYKEDSLFCLNKELEKYITNPIFVEHFKDAIDLRTKEFYKNRLLKKS